MVIPIYDINLQIVITNDIDKFSKIIPENNKEDIYATTWGHNYKNKSFITVVLNFDNKYMKVTHGVIAHESNHVVSMICDRLGISIDPNNDEATSYLLDYIVDKIHKFINKKGFKIG